VLVLEGGVTGEIAEEAVAGAPVFVAWHVRDRERHVTGDLGGLVEDAAHPMVGCEGGPFLDADLGELGAFLGADRVEGFVVDDLGEVLEVTHVGGMDRIERLARNVVVHGGGRVVGVGEGIDAGLFERCDSGGRVAAMAHEGPDHEPDSAWARVARRVASGRTDLAQAPLRARAGREIISQHGQHVAVHVLRSKRAVSDFLYRLGGAERAAADDG
jgi:hypothetical protein